MSVRTRGAAPISASVLKANSSDNKISDGRGASQMSSIVVRNGRSKATFKDIEPVRIKTSDGRKSLIERQAEYKTSHRSNANNNFERKLASPQQLMSGQMSSKRIKLDKFNPQNRLNSTFSLESKLKAPGYEPYLVKIKRLDGEVVFQKQKLKTLMERNETLETELESSNFKNEIQTIKICELTEDVTRLQDLVSTLKSEVYQQRQSLQEQQNNAENLAKDHSLEVQYHVEEKSELLVKVENLAIENVALKNDLIDLGGEKGPVLPGVKTSFDLEKETEKFLETISCGRYDNNLKIKANSKDGNVRINIKISVRRSNEENYANTPLELLTPYQSVSVTENEIGSVGFTLSTGKEYRPKFRSRTTSISSENDLRVYSEVNQVDDEVDVFVKYATPSGLTTSAPDKAGTSSFVEASSIKNQLRHRNRIENLEVAKANSNSENVSSSLMQDSVNFLSPIVYGESNSELMLSSRTLNRALDLDCRLEDLWSNLCKQTDNLDQLKSEERRFTFALNNLEEELMKSKVHQRKLAEDVSIVKKLFH